MTVTAQRTTPLYAVLGVAALVSAAVVWLASGELVAAASFLGGVAVLIVAANAIARAQPTDRGEELAPPDWSVTVAAIERPGEAVAIVDRANRLVCANRAYSDWFGAGNAPPNLQLDRPALEALARAAREAWREGSGEAAGIDSADGTRRWTARAERAGRGEDYLVWRFEGQAEEDFVADLGRALAGPLGHLLSRSGIEAALVGSDGLVRATAPGFAVRVAGDASATMAGQDFANLLRSDERDRIFFAREGRRGSPQTLIHVPLGEVAATRAPDADAGPSLMLLVDAGVGLGGAGESAGSAATPQLEALLGALPLGLAMTDRDGRFLFANTPFRRAAGIADKPLPPFPSDLVVREDKGPVVDAVRRFGKGPASATDMAIRLRGTPDDPVSLGIAGVRGLGDAAVLLSLVDSTEETRLKRQVAQATKMQAVGQLAGGVAHDFNNVLTAVIGTCDLMLLRHTPGDSDYDDIQQIRANSNRAAALTRQLLAFSRQQTLRPEVLQVPDVVSEVSQLLKRLLGEKIELKVHHDRELGPVRADPQQLEQVIVNLAVNARDAMQAKGDGSGKLSLATRRVTARDVRKMGSEIIPEGEYTVLVVQDSGGGIPPEHLGKIFEPFFTTKQQGRGGAQSMTMGGTGLGLSTVYGIVKQSGGFIFADNIPATAGSRAGARFSVYLPVYSGEMPARAPKAEAAPTGEWSGGGKILLVEDEDMVRAVAERALTRAGYSVTACADGEEGLAAVANGGEFDIVVSDVVMPGMDGPAMARAIRKAKPALPILFMSGYAEEQLRNDIDIADMHFIAKPFSVQQISDKVGAVLGAARG
ncbi:Blue-light-activated protein [Tsuneonella dongtanensis]|uniref:histidine kinase n=1 Tax=Tsuneonella dongtanensis TaxID=692370 RepID=A0A1B2ACQ3_9SPHN|nr:response regulator [Tsuneonella dongtanensis]ANY19878.1 Blue-light-activated protein [Tsuneonella dongtanensis]